MQAAFSEHHVENPEFMGIHYMDATSVEECWRLLRQTGKSISYESLAHVPRYSAWLAEQDWADAYERHRANLQLIGLNDPEKRWVLKNPSHLVALDSLMKVYPDALVVCTHRDPVVSIASACSLSAEATAGTSTTFVGETIGRTQLEMLSRSWRTFVSSRSAYDPAQFVDVEYDDFVADPVRTTRHIYDAFGLDWTPEVDAAVTALDAESRSGGRRPKHAYSLDDYGLDRSRGPGRVLRSGPIVPGPRASERPHEGQRFGDYRDVTFGSGVGRSGPGRPLGLGVRIGALVVGPEVAQDRRR